MNDDIDEEDIREEEDILSGTCDECGAEIYEGDYGEELNLCEPCYWYTIRGIVIETWDETENWPKNRSAAR